MLLRCARARGPTAPFRETTVTKQRSATGFKVAAPNKNEAMYGQLATAIASKAAGFKPTHTPSGAPAPKVELKVAPPHKIKGERDA